MTSTRSVLWASLLLACAGCGSTPLPDAGVDPVPETSTGGAVPLDPANLLAAGLVRSVSTEECTLSGGTVTQCYRITVTSRPSEHVVGPFCPRNISDGPEVSGVWFEGGTLYDADGAFIQDLAAFYSDDVWQLYDPVTGDVHVTDTQVSCEAAARPDVAPEYQNYCVECDIDYYDALFTYVIPVTPVASASPSEFGRNVVGIALNGVNFDPPAPTAAILAAHTIAALDDCGGHVNPHAGYHYHAATGCTEEVSQDDAHPPLIGYALDGFAIFARSTEGGSEPSDLDACRGHSDSTRGYHYHVASPGENALIGCFHGEHGCSFEGDVTDACDATGMTVPPLR